MKYFLSSIIFSLFFFSSCEEHCPEEEHAGEIYTVEAILEWHGAYAADGCGYLLKVEEESFKITNEEEIDPNFQGYALPVNISYTTHDKHPYYCGDNPSATYYDRVEMISIDKR